ncbi:hypothetical protein [Candidatus Electronema sp. PJ]|uniref:hypothetical protein n=1 Tax=Candidatus Electronema sp. PJ TaxID=3401572 RepID=UPI003AA94DD0
MNFLKNTAVYIALLIISVCFFYYINSMSKPLNKWEMSRYITPDSKTYLDVGNWLVGKCEFVHAKDSIAIRPFFYPLVVAILESIHPLAIIIFQLILWQIQIFIVYFCSLKISKSKLLAFFIALISISIVSNIGISLHVLTETITSFFITFSLLMLFVFSCKKSYIYISFYLLSLSFCSVVRPSFLYIYILSTIMIVAFNLKDMRFIYVLSIAMTVIPISAQSYIMKKHFNTYKISFIDTFAINDYFLSGLELYKRNLEGDSYKYQYIHTIRDARRRYIAEMIARDGYKKASENIKKVFLDNLTGYPVETFRQFKDLVVENSTQPSSIFISENKEMNIFFKNVTLLQSRFILTINIFSVLFFTIIFSIFILNKRYIIDNYIMFTSLLFFCIYFTYLSTGVTFWQGDRFLIPIYYTSIILFIYQAKILFQVIRNTSSQLSSIYQENDF